MYFKFLHYNILIFLIILFSNYDYMSSSVNNSQLFRNM